MTLRQQQADRVRQVATWLEGWAELRPTVEALQAAADALCPADDDRQARAFESFWDCRDATPYRSQVQRAVRQACGVVETA